MTRFLQFFMVSIYLFSCSKDEQVISKKWTPLNLTNAEYYLSLPKQKSFFQKIEKPATSVAGDVLAVNSDELFQSMDGFGLALTGGSAQLIYRMDPIKRGSLLRELFGSNGISVLRIGIGATDLDSAVFSYEEEPGKFSLEKSKSDLIPLLKEIIAIYPEIKIMASPWSAPVWMKDNNSSRGGALMEKYYVVYAEYLAKYIQEMAKEGIPIWSITPQNEPLNPGNNPSMYMSAQMQGNFIAKALGPVFQSQNIQTKIVVYDHNCDHPEYAIELLNVPEVRKYVNGSAFHLYAGDISAMSKVHMAHPDKDLYFTEQWTSAKGDFAGDFMWHMKNIVIGSVNNYAKAVIEWNLATDTSFGPHTPGGCSDCLGALTIGGQEITRNQSYYIVMQAAKFIPPGSIRLGVLSPAGIQAAAFKRSDGKIVILIQNEGGVKNISLSDTNLSLAADSIVTIIL